MNPKSLTEIDSALAETVDRKMAAIEARLVDVVGSNHPPVAAASNYLLMAGGKRFRPTLTVLASQFGDPNAPGITTAAVVIELTHLATLYHDDVIDDAIVRRGRHSANKEFGNSVAILTGDFLFARASALLAELGPEAVRFQAKTFERMVTGQIMEISGAPDDADQVSHYLEVLADKTGSLIAAATHFGATLAGAPPHVAESLTSFGERFGVAFQLSDDLLDVTADENIFGKEVGKDLKASVATLPVLLALSSKDGGSSKLRELLANKDRPEKEHNETLKLLADSEFITQAREVMDNWLGQARNDLASLPDCPAKEALVALCDGVRARVN